MKKVYRYSFRVLTGIIVREKDITHNFHSTAAWLEHEKEWTGQSPQIEETEGELCYYAMAEVEEDGSFKII